jgi:hypothetical protein
MELFTPLYKSKNPKKRIKWINNKFEYYNYNHLLILENILNNDEIEEVRLSANQKINDQNTLARIVYEVEDEKIYEFLINRISDQTIIADLANNSTKPSLKKLACLSLSDQNLLTSIALSSKDKEIFIIAFNKITSLFHLFNILINRIDSFDNSTCNLIRERFKSEINNSNDQKLFAEFVSNESSPWLYSWSYFSINRAILEKISDPEILTELVIKRKLHGKNEIFSKIKDENLLTKILLGGIVCDKEVISWISNEDLLCQILLKIESELVNNSSEEKFELVILCISKISNHDFLDQIINKIVNKHITWFKNATKDRDLRYKIASKLKAIYKLDKLSEEHKSKILALVGTIMKEAEYYHTDELQGNSCSMHDDRTHVDQRKKLYEAEIFEL